MWLWGQRTCYKIKISSDFKGNKIMQEAVQCNIIQKHR